MRWDEGVDDGNEEGRSTANHLTTYSTSVLRSFPICLPVQVTLMSSHEFLDPATYIRPSSRT